MEVILPVRSYSSFLCDDIANADVVDGYRAPDLKAKTAQRKRPNPAM
jgi:hypothetical protein